MIIDTHCHLDYFDLEEIDSIVARAEENSVSILQTIGTKKGELEKVLSIAKKYNNVCCAIGVHPCEVDANDIIKADYLELLCKDERVTGIGETGIDLYHSQDNKDAQIESFNVHIDVASRVNLPLIIHVRNSDDEVYEVLKNRRNNADFKFLIHCFASDWDFAKKILDLDGYISFSGIVTFKNALAIQDVVKKCPRDKILVETDSPFLAPTPFRGKRNEPAYTKNIVEFISNMRGESFEEVCEYTTSNFISLTPRIGALVDGLV